MKLERYKISDKELERMYKKLDGDTRKIKAISLMMRGGHRQEDIAYMCGVARMTLYRWRMYDEVFQKEIDRQFSLLSKHWDKQARKNAPTVSQIMADQKLLEMVILNGF